MHKARRVIRNRARPMSTAVAFGLLCAVIGCAVPALLESGGVQAAEQSAGATVPDSAYGEGGTKVSFANEQRHVTVEVWRDADGVVRERHESPGGGEEYWGFFFQDGSSSSDWGGGMIAVRPMERPADRWELRVYAPGNQTLKEASFLSRDELDSELAHWHAQMRSWVNGFIRSGQTGAR